jgi:ubiquinone biosynthesis protein UbiJ
MSDAHPRWVSALHLGPGEAFGVTDPTAAFFEGLRQHDRQPALARRSGIVRIDVDDDGRQERWFVAIDDGTVKVSKRNQSADSIVRVEKQLLDRIVTGNANAVTAMLRGEVSLQGDWNLLIVFQRLFPSPA